MNCEPTFNFSRWTIRPRVIVVTSSLPAEGKTTAAVNIALVLAEAGKSGLPDGRRPT